MPVKIVSPNADLSFHNEGSLTKKEFKDAREDFNRSFKYGQIGQIKDTTQNFEFDDLAIIVGTSNTPNVERLVVVHFAMNQNNMVYGFSVVDGQQDPNDSNLYTYTEPEYPSHILTDGKFEILNLNNPLEKKEWTDSKADYFSSVRIKRTTNSYFENLSLRGGGCDSSKPRPLGCDPEKIIMIWSREIKKMYIDTATNATLTYRAAIDSVSLDPSLSRNYNVEFQHGIAFFVQKKTMIFWGAVVDDDSYISIYKNKAADYGNLCPPKCKEYTYPKV